jgi:hypothetical protein
VTHYEELQNACAQGRMAERAETGRRGEYTVATLLRRHGREVEMMKPKHPWDMKVDGKWKVEIKTATPQAYFKGLRWEFEIMRNGVMNEAADLYVLRLEDVPYTENAVHLLMVGPIGKTKVVVSFLGLLNGQGQLAQDFRTFAKTGRPPRRFADIPWTESEAREIDYFDGTAEPDLPEA